ncbi:MAG: HEAT repeat domain-containing protein [Thermoguttaceae bacterium]
MRLLSSLLAVALVGACFRAETPQRKEPTFEGKTLSEWIARTKSKDRLVRSDAAMALGNIGPEARNAVPALTELLKDKDEVVARPSGIYGAPDGLQGLLPGSRVGVRAPGAA